MILRRQKVKQHDENLKIKDRFILCIFPRLFSLFNSILHLKRNALATLAKLKHIFSNSNHFNIQYARNEPQFAAWLGSAYNKFQHPGGLNWTWTEVFMSSTFALDFFFLLELFLTYGVLIWTIKFARLSFDRYCVYTVHSIQHDLQNVVNWDSISWEGWLCVHEHFKVSVQISILCSFQNISVFSTLLKGSRSRSTSRLKFLFSSWLQLTFAKVEADFESDVRHQLLNHVREIIKKTS